MEDEMTLNRKDAPVKQEQKRVSLGKQKSQRYFIIKMYMDTRNPAIQSRITVGQEF
jgi:hypothetical protein